MACLPIGLDVFLGRSLSPHSGDAGSFLTSERCSNISLNLVCTRASWRYCLVSLRHELLRKVDCVSSSRDHRPCFVASFPKHTILAMVAVVQPRFFSHFREVQQYFSELGLPKGMLEILPGITQARVVAQGGLCLQFTGSSAMFRGLVSKAYDLGNFGLQHVGEVCVLSSRGSFLTSERCSNFSLNLVCPRACWRYCLVSLRHELLRKVDCVPQSWKLFGIPFLSPSTT